MAVPSSVRYWSQWSTILQFVIQARAIPPIHWEIKGRFRKRVVLANVPSFRFSFRENIRRNHPFGNHPFVNTKQGHWEITGRFPKGWFWRTYPRSGFRSGEHPPKPPFWKPPFCEPPTYSATPRRHPNKLRYPLPCRAHFAAIGLVGRPDSPPPEGL